MRNLLLWVVLTLSAYASMVFEDKTSAYGIEEVRSNSALFTQRDWISETYSTSSYWLKIRLENDENRAITRFISFRTPVVTYVTAYAYDQNGNLSDIQKNGASVSLHDKKLQVSDTLFVYTIDPHSALDVYIYMKSNFFMKSFYDIFDMQDYISFKTMMDRMDYMILGAFVVLFLYNIFLLMMIRESIFFIYLGYLLGIIGLSYININGQILKEYFNLGFFEVFNIAYFFTGYLGIMFIWKTVSVDVLPPRWLGYIYRLLSFLMILTFLYGLYDPEMIVRLVISYKLSFIVVGFILLMTVLGFKNGRKLVRYLSIGWTIFGIGAVVLLLTSEGYIQDPLYFRAVFVGSFFEALIFSLVLSYYFRDHKHLATQDKLTGMYNRHAIDMRMSDRKKHADVYGTEFGVMLIDIDHFKKINDTYGHLVGDKVLIEVSNILQKSIKRNDILGRWGGEEFIIIMPHIDVVHLLERAEEIRQMMAGHRFETVDSVTASFGLTLYKDEEMCNETIKRADEALYLSKQSGRNKVTSL